MANGTVKWYIQCKKQLVVLKEKMGLSYDPVIILLGIYSKDNKNYVLYSNLYTNDPTSFICNSPNYKALKCPSKGKWLNKLWYIHIINHYVKWYNNSQGVMKS